MTIRTGIGIDAHRFAPERPLILGGVRIPHPLGLLGHSDADVLVHALIDALLGAAAAGDIGGWFPDRDPRYRNADSLELLRHVRARLGAEGWRIHNTDATVMAEAPHLAAHIEDMRRRMADAMSLEIEQVSVKATTLEGMGALGRGEGIAAQAIATLSREIA